jgi:hypothetical protein
MRTAVHTIPGENRRETAMAEARAPRRVKPRLVWAVVLAVVVLLGGVAAATHLFPCVTEWLQNAPGKSGDSAARPQMGKRRYLTALQSAALRL